MLVTMNEWDKKKMSNYCSSGIRSPKVLVSNGKNTANANQFSFILTFRLLELNQVSQRKQIQFVDQ